MQLKKLCLSKKNLKYWLIGIYLFHVFSTHVFLPWIHSKAYTHNTYPFYDWNLFSWTPREFKDWFFVLIREIDGRPIKGGKIYVFNRELLRPQVKWLLHDQTFMLGRAIENNDQNLLNVRRQFENNLFKGVESAEYELIKGDIDIREVRKTHEVKNLKVLGRFRYQK